MTSYSHHSDVGVDHHSTSDLMTMAESKRSSMIDWRSIQYPQSHSQGYMVSSPHVGRTSGHRAPSRLSESHDDKCTFAHYIASSKGTVCNQ